MNPLEYGVSPEAEWCQWRSADSADRDRSEWTIARVSRPGPVPGWTRGVKLRSLMGDIFDPPFDEDSFDHVFMCFVLEHLSQPVEALGRLKGVPR